MQSLVFTELDIQRQVKLLDRLQKNMRRRIYTEGLPDTDEVREILRVQHMGAAPLTRDDLDSFQQSPQGAKTADLPFLNAIRIVADKADTYIANNLLHAKALADRSKFDVLVCDFRAMHVDIESFVAALADTSLADTPKIILMPHLTVYRKQTAQDGIRLLSNNYSNRELREILVSIGDSEQRQPYQVGAWHAVFQGTSVKTVFMGNAYKPDLNLPLGKEMLACLIRTEAEREKDPSRQFVDVWQDFMDARADNTQPTDRNSVYYEPIVLERNMRILARQLRNMGTDIDLVRAGPTIDYRLKTRQELRIAS